MDAERRRMSFAADTISGEGLQNGLRQQQNESVTGQNECGRVQNDFGMSQNGIERMQNELRREQNGF